MKLILTGGTAKVEPKESKRVVDYQTTMIGKPRELPGLKYCDITVELTFTTYGNIEGLTDQMVITAIADKVDDMNVRIKK